MIKYRIENDIQAVDFAIDDKSNALVINTDKGAIEVPFNTAMKLLNTVKTELVSSEENNRRNKAGKLRGMFI